MNVVQQPVKERKHEQSYNTFINDFCVALRVTGDSAFHGSQHGDCGRKAKTSVG